MGVKPADPWVSFAAHRGYNKLTRQRRTQVGGPLHRETFKKEKIPMPDNLDKISDTIRWELATKGLTGAYIALSGALERVVGQEKFDEINGSLWYAGGKGAKDFAVSVGMPTDGADDINEVTHSMAKASMGPEFVFEIVESGKDRCVGKTSQCPWHQRWREQGLKMDTCGAGHQRWGDGAVESLDPNFTFKLTKNMLRGDPHCEWVIERKK